MADIRAMPGSGGKVVPQSGAKRGKTKVKKKAPPIKTNKAAAAKKTAVTKKQTVTKRKDYSKALLKDNPIVDASKKISKLASNKGTSKARTKSEAKEAKISARQTVRKTNKAARQDMRKKNRAEKDPKKTTS